MRKNLKSAGGRVPNYLKAHAGNQRPLTINQEGWLCRAKGLEWP